MQESKHITIIADGKKTVLGISTILYVLKVGNHVEIHVSGGKIYKTRMALGTLEDMLGDGFIKAHRGCIVSVMAI
ncbi:MAG: LytTR family transcriptional regulator DNA-binding domain-containing protein, partial [Wujia sp.]